MGSVQTIPYATPPAPGSPGRGWRFLWLWLFSSLAVVGILAALLLWAGSVFWSSLDVDTEALTPQQIEQIGHLKLPPGVANLKAHYWAFQDFSLRLRFTIPPDEMDALIDSTYITRPLSTTQIPYAFDGMASQKPWWTPGQPSKFEAGEYDPLGNATTAPATRPVIFQHILIDQTNPKEYTVWMIVNDQ